MKLYHSPGSCSLACHIALEEAAAEFEPVTIRLPAAENFEPEYLKIQPTGFVPLLEMTNGEHLTEAVAILLHVARAYPDAGLLPEAGSGEEARVFEWLAWLTNTMHIAYACLWRPERFSADPAARRAIADEATARIKQLNWIVERRLAGRDFAAGTAYSVADLFLLVFFRWANRIGVAASREHPAWTAWARRIEDRPAVSRVLHREGISLWK
jgi:glutathione S-transferase